MFKCGHLHLPSNVIDCLVKQSRGCKHASTGLHKLTDSRTDGVGVSSILNTIRSLPPVSLHLETHTTLQNTHACSRRLHVCSRQRQGANIAQEGDAAVAFLHDKRTIRYGRFRTPPRGTLDLMPCFVTDGICSGLPCRPSQQSHRQACGRPPPAGFQTRYFWIDYER